MSWSVRVRCGGYGLRAGYSAGGQDFRPCPEGESIRPEGRIEATSTAVPPASYRGDTSPTGKSANGAGAVVDEPEDGSESDDTGGSVGEDTDW